METTNEQLKIDWQTYQEKNPNKRIYDAAIDLNVSEEQLLVLDTKADVTRLDGINKDILGELKTLGHVMALTRNHHCVIETYGSYDDLKFFGDMGLAVNPGIDLRLFLKNWGHTYAVEAMQKSGLRKSIQFFNKQGKAVHKIYLNSKSNEAAFEDIKLKFSSKSRSLEILKYEDLDVKTYESSINKEQFLQDWSALKDTHDFHKLLMNHKVKRIEAMNVAEGHFTRSIAVSAIEKLCSLLCETSLSFMCFVGNQEMIQIFTGQANNFKKLGSWLNFLESEFNLHLESSAIGKSFVVTKPSVDGNITSVELYDHDGELICQFFGARKPGFPELSQWRAVVDKL